MSRPQCVNLPLNAVQSGSIACFERRLDKLWNGTGVIYNPDIDARQVTKSKKDIRVAVYTHSRMRKTEI